MWREPICQSSQLKDWTGNKRGSGQGGATRPETSDSFAHDELARKYFFVSHHGLLIDRSKCGLIHHS